MSVKQEVIVLDAEAPAEEDLQLLNAKNAAKTKYPPGCPVWHDLASSTSKQLDGRHGVVKNVFMDMDGGGRFYKVEGENALLRQEQLSFAMNCPVKVRGMVANYPSIELDGRIVCPKPGRGGKEASYSIQFVDGGRFSVKLGVGGDLVAYREEAGEQAGGGVAVKAEVEPAVSPNPSTIKSCLKRKSVDSRSSASDNSQRHKMAPLHHHASKKQRSGAPPAFPSIASDSSTLERDVPSSITYDSEAKLRRSEGAARAGASGTTTDDGTEILVITIPLWLQRDRRSQQQLFFYLIGSASRNPHGLGGLGLPARPNPLISIGRSTNCYVKVNFESRRDYANNNEPLPPMTISVSAYSRATAPFDLDNARLQIQKLLLDYVGDDGSRGRLVYDVASSCKGNHRPENSSCRAVRAEDPFGREDRRGCRFLTVVELPFHSNGSGERVAHAAHLIKSHVQNRLRTEAGAYISVVGNEFRVPVKLCDDYLLVMASSVHGIDKGVGIVEEVNRQHIQTCFCKSGGAHV